jgi:hypothetical protein
MAMNKWVERGIIALGAAAVTTVAQATTAKKPDAQSKKKKKRKFWQRKKSEPAEGGFHSPGAKAASDARRGEAGDGMSAAEFLDSAKSAGSRVVSGAAWIKDKATRVVVGEDPNTAKVGQVVEPESEKSTIWAQITQKAPRGKKTEPPKDVEASPAPEADGHGTGEILQEAGERVADLAEDVQEGFWGLAGWVQGPGSPGYSSSDEGAQNGDAATVIEANFDDDDAGKPIFERPAKKEAPRPENVEARMPDGSLPDGELNEENIPSPGDAHPKED